MDEHEPKPWASFRDVMAGTIAIAVIGSICYNALVEQSEAAITALVSASGAVSGWLYRQAASAPFTNGNGNGNGTKPKPDTTDTTPAP
jgi:hypothetical protein